MRIKGVIAGTLLCVMSCANATAPSAAAPRYQDASLPVDERVNDLISRMTLEEKVSQLGHTSAAIPRLGIPEYNWWSEGLHGVARAGYATVFPQAIGMAATFDAPLMHEVAGIISTEFRAKYYATLGKDGSTGYYRGLTVWSPNINIFRDPRWGRGQETYGEDPYLTSRLGVAFVTGLQGDDPKYLKTVSTPKHFAVHSGPEATRHTANVNVSKHDLQDTYLPAFRATVMEGKAESVMCAYNAIDGQPACANPMLLDEYLRRKWGFKGYVVSDCGAAADIFRGHAFKANAEEGVTAAFKAGMDLICGDYRNNMSTEQEGMVGAVRKGLLPEAVLDESLRRLFSARFRLGMFDPPASVPYSKITPAANDTQASREVALRMAQKAMVLLKNKDGFLPLKQAPKTIAVIGPNANSLDALVGNYNGTPSKPVTVLAGIRNRFPQAHVIYAEGTGLVGPTTASIPAEALCVDATCKVHGLKGDFFDGMKLSGGAKLSRVDRTLQFAFSDIASKPPLPTPYSARWTGVLVPPETGEYHLGFTGRDGYRLWLEGKLVTEDWTYHDPATSQTAVVQLQKGHAYPIRIEYFQQDPGGEVNLIWNRPSERGDDAIEAAHKADVVVMVGGLSPRIEGEEMKIQAEGFAGGDRTSIDLPAPQQRLLERLQTTGKPVVLVLMSGSAIAVNWADDKLPAIVEAWYPGEEGGTAVAGLLAGDFSPAGRLPVTFYKSVDQLPAFDDYSMDRRTYRYFDGEVLYPFGYGLSYTTFKYGHARVSNASIASTEETKIAVDITNSGAMSGDEVVQLYVTRADIDNAPVRALQGFQRIHLDKGQTKTVEFRLRDRDLSVVDDAGQHRIVAGKVDVWIGGAQPLRRAGLPNPAGVRTQFAITSSAVLAD